MTVKMLIFDFRDSEKAFFENKKFENFDIKFFKESLNEEFVKTLSADDLEKTTIISVFIDSEVSSDVINAFKNLRIISTRSTGIDHINHRAAMERNIDVINVESYGSKSVAQFTMGLIIALVRKIKSAAEYIINKDNYCESFIGRDLSKLTIGVVGTGAIGASVCRLASAFEMNILAYDLKEKKELLNEINMKYTDLNTLVKNSDIITLHLPFTGDNLHMFRAEYFNIMKQNAYFINTSRGELVDIFALYEAVTNKTIAGTALDVVTCEQVTFKCSGFTEKLGADIICLKEAQIVQELAVMPNVIITPHIAYETQDAVDYLLEMSFRGISDCIKGGNGYKMP